MSSARPPHARYRHAAKRYTLSIQYLCSTSKYFKKEKQTEVISWRTGKVKIINNEVTLILCSMWRCTDWGVTSITVASSLDAKRFKVSNVLEGIVYLGCQTTQRVHMQCPYDAAVLSSVRPEHTTAFGKTFHDFLPRLFVSTAKILKFLSAINWALR